MMIVRSITRDSSSTFTQDNTVRSINDGIGKGEQKSILFLSSASWPEPTATAAGTRTSSLLHLLASSDLFTSVHFGCGANLPSSFDNDVSHNISHKRDDVHWHHIKLNRGDEMNALLNTIQDVHGPIKAVVFDRFYTEEAFSFMVKEACPNALRILDMQDVHSLRIGRQNLVLDFDRNIKLSTPACRKLSSHLIDNVMSFNPKSACQATDTFDKMKARSYDTFLRELASIHRSDLVLVCSPDELKYLQSWSVPAWKMEVASFFCDNINGKELPAFDDRSDFVTVGGFKHPPNLDSAKLLREEIWPRIRQQLGHAKLHIYGAYPTQDILSLHSDKLGFLVHGRIHDLDSELRKRRVLLAPLRFGAGIKGKIVDAWRCGCPVVSTPIGAEGMVDNNAMHTGHWGGSVTSTTDDFVEAAISLYTKNTAWNKAQATATLLVNKLFNKESNFKLVQAAVENAMMSLNERRAADVTGAMLWHQSNRSTEYFSKWIELKEKEF
ncbi:hypothetical protein ACHAWO_008364 [Cyclotella atomus]|uniref:Glycosyltransferase n=1 Tax=Cyclotella atomus TaxID=382360 RepID=A0ABD3N1L6_9STRA